MLPASFLGLHMVIHRRLVALGLLQQHRCRCHVIIADVMVIVGFFLVLSANHLYCGGSLVSCSKTTCSKTIVVVVLLPAANPMIQGFGISSRLFVGV